MIFDRPEIKYILSVLWGLALAALVELSRNTTIFRGPTKGSKAFKLPNGQCVDFSPEYTSCQTKTPNTNQTPEQEGGSRSSIWTKVKRTLFGQDTLDFSIGLVSLVLSWYINADEPSFTRGLYMALSYFTGRYYLFYFVTRYLVGIGF